METVVIWGGVDGVPVKQKVEGLERVGIMVSLPKKGRLERGA